MAKLTIDSLTKWFTEKDGTRIVAVDDVSIDTADGEFLVLVGPSGCGKSTTLRCIAGLETVSEGEILLDGQSIIGQRPRERDIAMVFQSYALYPHMTVRGNMAFGLEESTDMPQDEIDERVEETAEMMGIRELLDRKPGELSGGQRQRVALGRAIVRDPEIFLMDEPLSNLDAKLRSQMRTELQRLQEELDVTTVYVTHDQTEAMTMGHRIAVLDGGELQQLGTPLECYHQPANLFVAGFIGEPSMNFFEVSHADGHIEGGGIDYQLSETIAEKTRGQSTLTIGVRPDAIELQEPDERSVQIHCDVDVVEPMGKENNVYLRPRATDSKTFVATIDGQISVRDLDEAIAYISESAIHVFEDETGVALHNREQVETSLTQVNI